MDKEQHYSLVTSILHRIKNTDITSLETCVKVSSFHGKSFPIPVKDGAHLGESLIIGSILHCSAWIL